MLSKLAYRNARRSIKDYVIYIITVTLAFSFIFAFSLLSFSKEVLELNSVMENFKFVIYVVNVFIALVVCFLINYTIKFMFGKRAKEFGTYMILGIRKRKISNLFTIENIILGFMSFILAIPLGFLFSQIMSLVITSSFKLEEIVRVSFSIKAILYLLLNFVIIFLFVLVFARRRIKKMKVYDLLYYDKRNEKTYGKHKKVRNYVFIFSLCLGIFSLLLFDSQFKLDMYDEPNMGVIFICVGLLILSIYGVIITLSDFILKLILSKKALKYKGDNLFVSRTFFSKVKTMSFTLGTLSILITLSMVALNLSSLFKGMFEYQLNISAPYDISVETSPDKINEYLSVIKNEYTIEDMHIYSSYEYGDIINRAIESNGGVMGFREKDHYLKLTDYNKLLEMMGLEEVSLEQDEYILHVTKEYKDILKNDKSLEYIILENGVKLKQKSFIYENYSYTWGRGYGFIVVVPDIILKEMDTDISHIVVNTKEKTTEEFDNKLTSLSLSDICEYNEDGFNICYSNSAVSVRGAIESQNNGFMTITSFVCFYISFIFIAVVGTILAIQSLSDSTKYKYRYRVLNKLGVREEELYRTVRKQLLIFFLVPLIYPVIVSFFTLLSMNRVFKVALTNDFMYLVFYLVNLGVFLVIYFIYFLATYFGFKKNISE